MQFIHAREYLDGGDIVVVNCSHQCNIRLMDDSNFSSFKSKRKHSYYGGAYKMFPVRIKVPHSGNWNVTIDIGGGRANLEYSINYQKG